MKTTKVSEFLETKQAVIFDLFHTLTSVEVTLRENLRRTYDLLGVARESWRGQLLKYSHDRLTGKKTDPLAIITEMARAIDSSISEETIRLALENRIASFAHSLVHMPRESQQVLCALKSSGKRIGLLSNADVMEIAAWNRCPAAGLFDSAVFSCHVGYAKPEAEIFRISLNELGVEPSQAVFVGDGGSDELQAARSVGMTAIMVTGIIQDLWPDRIPELRQQADFVIAKLNELLSNVE